MFSDFDVNIFSASTKKILSLKKSWYDFFKSLNINVEVITDSNLKFKFDYKLYGIEEFYIKIFDVDSIDEVINKDVLISELPSLNFFSNLIILGNKPFISENGFYVDETYIQLGWVYNLGASKWDNLMLKDNFDISNSIFYIQNLDRKSVV